MASGSNQSGAGATPTVTPGTGQSAAPPFNSPSHHQQQHQPPPHHSLQSLPNYQYHALLHDRLTAPMGGGGHCGNNNHNHNSSGHNHSSHFSHSSVIPSRSRGGSEASTSIAGGGGGQKMSDEAKVLARTSTTTTTKVQLLNKHSMDGDRDILHSLMMGGSQSQQNESLVDSTSPPPEQLLRNIYSSGGGGGSSSSSSLISCKRNYSPTQFAYLCDAVAAASAGSMTGGSGGGAGGVGGLNGLSVCPRSSSNASSNCDSEKGLLGALVDANGAGAGAMMAVQQGTDKKLPNSIRGEQRGIVILLNIWVLGGLLQSNRFLAILPGQLVITLCVKMTACAWLNEPVKCVIIR